MSYHGNYLDQYDSSKAYFHMDPRRECIHVYEQIDRLDLNVYVWSCILINSDNYFNEIFVIILFLK